MTMSRRNFLKTAGIVTAGVGLGGIMTGCGENKTAGAESTAENENVMKSQVLCLQLPCANLD